MVEATARTAQTRQAAPLAQSSPPTQALVDVLDHLLETGVVLDGHIVLSVAGVDLIHVGLRALLASAGSAARLMAPAPAPARPA